MAEKEKEKVQTELPIDPHDMGDPDEEMFHKFEITVEYGDGRKPKKFRSEIGNGPVTVKHQIEHYKTHRMFTGAKKVEIKGIPGGDPTSIQQLMERKAGLADEKSGKEPQYVGVTPRRVDK